MENILYLDDYINLYVKKENKIIIFKPYKKTLWEGKIIDREKFMKIYLKLLESNHLKNNILASRISVIINPSYKEEDKKLLQSILEDLNYKKITFLEEINYLKIGNKCIYCHFANTYFYFYYKDNLGKLKMKIYENDEINKELISEIIKLIGKNNIFIYGKNYQELALICEKNDYEYYYFEDASNFIITQILKCVK